MLYPYGVAATMLLCAAQAIPLDGTWQLTRIFRAGTPVTTRAIPLDSTVYIRVSLESHTGGWISGRLYRRYHGEPDRSKVEGGRLAGTGRWIIGVEIEQPAWARARTAAWLLGHTLRLRASPVPRPASPQLLRVSPDPPAPPAVPKVVTGP